MRRLAFVLAFLVLTVSAAFAADPSSVARITPEALKAKLDAGADVLIIDARSPGSYNSNPYRIKGDVRIAFSEIGERLKDLPKDKEIAVYCT